MIDIERMYKYMDLLEAKRFIPASVFMSAMEISYATFKRDLAVLRDRFDVPIVYDRDIGAYKLDQTSNRRRLPGIWFSPEEIKKIGDTFEAWANGKYEDIDWFCKSVKREDIAKKGDVLSPGRHIGTEALIGDQPRPLKEVLPSLSLTIKEQLATSASLGKQINEVLGKLSNGL